MTSPTPSANPGNASVSRQPSNPSVRRAFTLPARIVNKPRASSLTAKDSADGIETLFTHGFTKIVSFTAGLATSNAAPGSLPWRSSTERTLAVGPLRVYRVTSSNVSFLNSGSFLHTIFPRSQCWCVDGESKFVLRIRQNSYYRIELPFAEAGDKEKVEQFKNILGTLLQYEKTPCPFARGFEVELPEPPKSPVRRRPKKPTEKAKKWLFDRTWVPEDGPRPGTPNNEEYDSGTGSTFDEDDRLSVATGDLLDEVSTLELTPPASQRPTVPDRVRSFQALRSVTTQLEMLHSSLQRAAPNISLDQDYLGEESDPEEPLYNEEPESSRPADSMSLASTADTFYSFRPSLSRASTSSGPYVDAPSTPIQGKPWAQERGHRSPYNEAGNRNIHGPAVPHGGEEDHKKSGSRAPVIHEDREESPRGRGRHRRQASEITIRANSTETILTDYAPVALGHEGRSSSVPPTPPLVSDSDDSFEPPLLEVPTPPDTIRLRKLTGATQRRAFSPMPHPQNLFLPQTPIPRKLITAALVRRTCEALLGPPAHLVTLMLRIAAKISKGAFGFNTYRVRNAKKLPGSWESSSDDEEWGEDDYGIPLRNLDESSLRRRQRSSNSEVD